MLFPLERTIFNRENASGMYRPSMFYLGRTLAEMPQHLILMVCINIHSIDCSSFDLIAMFVTCIGNYGCDFIFYVWIAKRCRQVSCLDIVICM